MVAVVHAVSKGARAKTCRLLQKREFLASLSTDDLVAPFGLGDDHISDAVAEIVRFELFT